MLGHGPRQGDNSSKTQYKGATTKLEIEPKHAIICQSKGTCAIMPYFIVVTPSITNQMEVYYK